VLYFLGNQVDIGRNSSISNCVWRGRSGFDLQVDIIGEIASGGTASDVVTKIRISCEYGKFLIAHRVKNVENRIATGSVSDKKD